MSIRYLELWGEKHLLYLPPTPPQDSCQGQQWETALLLLFGMPKRALRPALVRFLLLRVLQQCL